MNVGAFNRYLCEDRHVSPPRTGNQTAAAWQQHRRQQNLVILVTGAINVQHNEQQVAVVLILSVRHAGIFLAVGGVLPVTARLVYTCCSFAMYLELSNRLGNSYWLS